MTVPGAVSAWVELAAKFGSMPLTEIVKPALEYAENGYPVPPVIAGYWRASKDVLVIIRNSRAFFCQTDMPPNRAQSSAFPKWPAPCVLLQSLPEKSFIAEHWHTKSWHIQKKAAATSLWKTSARIGPNGWSLFRQIIAAMMSMKFRQTAGNNSFNCPQHSGRVGTGAPAATIHTSACI